jgi:hypothetical protein
VLIPSILTLFVPLACRTSFGLALLIRCLIGFFESPSFPAVYHFFPVWIPIPEKTLMIPAIASGMYLGEIVGFSLSGILVDWNFYIGSQYWGGWQLVFYVFGLAGIAWFPYWALFAYESPDTHPYITPEERALIKEGKGYTTLHNLEKEGSGDENEEDSKYTHLLKVQEHGGNSSTPVQSPFVEYNYRSPSMEGTNPMIRLSFSAPKDGEVEERILNPGMQYINVDDANHVGEGRTLSILTDEADRQEIAKRIPWKNFFTHRVSLTLFLNNWTYVSYGNLVFFFFLLISSLNLLFCLFLLGFYWIYFIIRNAFIFYR